MWVKIMNKEVIVRLFLTLLPLMAVLLIPLIFHEETLWYTFLMHLTWIWFVVMLVHVANFLIRSLGRVMLRRTVLRDRPMKGLIQLLQMLLTLFGLIVIVSIIVGRSPTTLITGLGAFAAVLMLVFKDSILGFVAGVLLAENDMVRIGDWIEVPSSRANGIVEDVTLTIVKVRNFDNTIVTVSPYSLVTESFVNWRGMYESGGRRITREITLIYDYVKPCTSEFLERMKRFDADLAFFISAKQGQESRGVQTDTGNPEGLPDGTISTNLGLLRTYLYLYLHRHPDVNPSLELMIRTLPPTENGLPLQVYCFCKRKKWSEYESVQAGITEHILSVLPVFELHAFQNSSLRDNVINGLLEGGVGVDRIRDFPWGIAQ